MSISSALSNANSGLAASARRTDLVANNIANALTPGYTRREISVSERVIASGGAGVRVDGIIRVTDQVMIGERRIANGVLGRDQVVASAYASLNSSLGEPDDPFSLFGQYQRLESSLRTLGETPESVAYQAQALDSAKALASTFNTLSAEAQKARKDADTQIARDVQTVNAALLQIEKLNGDIRKASAGGKDAAALEDQRQGLIDQIASIIPVRELQRDHGVVDIMTQEGVFLLAGKAQQIEFTQAGFINHGVEYDGGAGLLSGLSVGGIDITPGGPGGGQAVRQGSIAGHFAVRDNIMPGYQTQLDALARDLVERMEGVDGTLPPGSPGLFTDAGDAFDPVAEGGLASRLAVNTAVDPGAGGALWRLRDGLGAVSEGPTAEAGLIRGLLDSLTEMRPAPAGSGLGGQHSASDLAAGVSSIIGVSRINAETTLAGSSARAYAMDDALTAITGVDTDTELQKMLLIEQAFAANARVLQAAQDMIRVLMEI